jgi:protein-disulfide isomerase
VNTARSLFVAIAMATLAGCGATPPKPAKPAPAAKAPEPARAPLHARAVVFLSARCQPCAELLKVLLPLQRELNGALGITVGFVGSVDADGAMVPPEDDAEIGAATIELCAGRSAGDEASWFRFLECVYEGDRWRALPEGWRGCAERAGIDAGKIATCAADGTGGDELAVSIAASEAVGVRAAPTIFFDDRPYFGERTREALLAQICFGAGSEATRPKACAAVEPPTPIAATLLSDSRCDAPDVCDVERELTFLEALVPNLELARVDFRTPEGRRLYDLVGVAGGPRRLPLLVVDGAIDGLAFVKSRLEDYLVRFGHGYLMPLGEGRDPLAEICDNGQDDDEDGAIDCADDSCEGSLACREEKRGRLDLFVMSRCPYAMMLLPAVDAFLDHMGRDRGQVDLRIELIGTTGAGGSLESMHGPDEVAEDLRLACAQDLYPDRYAFVKYAVCRAAAGARDDWRSCVPAGMSAKAIAKCAAGKKGRALVAASFAAADAAGVQASPTFLLNGKLPMDGRTAEEIRAAFCARNGDAAGCATPIQDAPPEEAETEGGGAGDSCE